MLLVFAATATLRAKSCNFCKHSIAMSDIEETFDVMDEVEKSYI